MVSFSSPSILSMLLKLRSGREGWDGGEGHEPKSVLARARPLPRVARVPPPCRRRRTEPLEMDEAAQVLDALNEVVVQLQLAEVLVRPEVVDAQDVWE